MWWFPGLFGMGFGFAITVLMLASTFAYPSKNNGLLRPIFIVLLCLEFPLLCGAVVFVILAETGRI